jgi:hypothetical protein
MQARTTVRAMLGALLGALLAFGAPGRPVAAEVRDGITFAADSRALFLPVREVGEAFGWPVGWEAASGTAYLREQAVSTGSLRRLIDGTALMPVRDLEDWGARVSWEEDAELARVVHEDGELAVRAGPKRVAVNKGRQRMRAWQGGRLVLDTRVSTGRAGQETPSGRFRAGPLKTPMLISRRYGNARMPWSVQVQGHVVIHGFHSVPRFSASRGCVRVPLTGRNPARWFYDWVDVGTPIVIGDRWP